MNKVTKQILLCVAIVVAVGLTCAIAFGFGKIEDKTSELQSQLLNDNVTTIQIKGTYQISKPLQVKGHKEFTGDGTIVMAKEAAQPQGADIYKKGSGWAFGCAKLSTLKANTQLNMFTIESGASLTVDGKVVIDGNGAANGVYVSKDGTINIKGNAVFRNAYYCNIFSDGKVTVAGGELQKVPGHNVVTNGVMDITAGVINGTDDGAVVFSTGTLNMKGGTVRNSKTHNIYIAGGGTFTCSGGANISSKIDSVFVEDKATAVITGGSISESGVHSIDNAGNINVSAVDIADGGIMNNPTGTMKIDDTTLSSTYTYSICNNGGNVTATNIKISKSDTYSVYNMNGSMVLNKLTVTGSVGSNLCNAAGSITVIDSVFGITKDKSVTVIGGEAKLKGVEIQGNSTEKYGVYVAGGKLDMDSCSVSNTKSTAIKTDNGTIVTLHAVHMSDITECGIYTSGGIVNGSDITMNNIGSHGVYNDGGEITLETVTINNVEKMPFKIKRVKPICGA